MEREESFIKAYAYVLAHSDVHCQLSTETAYLTWQIQTANETAKLTAARSILHTAYKA